VVSPPGCASQPSSQEACAHLFYRPSFKQGPFLLVAPLLQAQEIPGISSCGKFCRNRQTTAISRNALRAGRTSKSALLAPAPLVCTLPFFWIASGSTMTFWKPTNVLEDGYSHTDLMKRHGRHRSRETLNITTITYVRESLDTRAMLTYSSSRMSEPCDSLEWTGWTG
jgi:hypothetical protein